MGYHGVKLVKSHRDNHPGERRSDAAMAADPEGKVRIPGSIQDQIARVDEDLAVTVRSQNGC